MSFPRMTEEAVMLRDEASGVFDNATIEDFFKTQEIHMRPEDDQHNEGFIEGFIELPPQQKYASTEDMRDWHTARMTNAVMWTGVLAVMVLVGSGLFKAVGWILGL